MNKKTNTILFILGGTVFNILITLISFILLLVIYSRFFPQLPEESAAWILPLIFVLSVAISFVVYRMVVKYITKKIDMEKYFDPIFGRRRPPPKKPS